MDKCFNRFANFIKNSELATIRCVRMILIKPFLVNSLFLTVILLQYVVIPRDTWWRYRTPPPARVIRSIWYCPDIVLCSSYDCIYSRNILIFLSTPLGWGIGDYLTHLADSRIGIYGIVQQYRISSTVCDPSLDGLLTDGCSLLFVAAGHCEQF